MSDRLDGTPDCYINLNSSGSGGTLQVQDDGTNRLAVTDEGKIVRHGGPVVLRRGAALTGTVLELDHGGTTQMSFGEDPGADGVYIRAAVSGDFLRLRADHLRLETSDASGDIASFRSSGGERLKVAWDDVAGVASIETPEDLSIKTISSGSISIDADADLEISGSTVTATATTDMKLHFGASTATTSKLQCYATDSGGVQRMLFQLGEQGVCEFKDKFGVSSSLLNPKDADDANTFILGVDDGTWGRLDLRRRQTSGDEKPGVLRLEPNLTTGISAVYIFAEYVGTTTRLYASDQPPGGGGVQHELASW